MTGVSLSSSFLIVNFKWLFSYITTESLVILCCHCLSGVVFTCTLCLFQIVWGMQWDFFFPYTIWTSKIQDCIYYVLQITFFWKLNGMLDISGKVKISFFALCKVIINKPVDVNFLLWVKIFCCSERGKLADPFYRLEHQEEDLQKKKEAAPVLVRLQHVSDARHADDYSLNKALRAQLRVCFWVIPS